MLADRIPQPYGPDAHKALKKLLGVRSADALVGLTEKSNDPFYSGSPANLREANWFAKLWHDLGFDRAAGAHLRRVHYKILSAGLYHPTYDRPYRNDQNDWEALNRASRHARYQGLIDPFLVLDERNPSPQVFVEPGTWEDPGAWLEEFGWVLPAYSLNTPDLRFPGVGVGGYDYDVADQSALLEIWVEKSTVNDVLVPLCRAEHVNLVQGKGYESIINTLRFLERAREHGKPAHIFYISDYDSAGRNMPVSAARQCQFWGQKMGNPEVTIESLILTRDQVDHYSLPGAPDDLDKVELDALEVYHPGVLGEVCQLAISNWRDANLEDRLIEAGAEAEVNANDAWLDASDDLSGRLDEIKDVLAGVIADHRPAIEALNRDLDVVRSMLTDLKHDVQACWDDDVDIDLPDRPEAEESDIDTEDMLYDSQRYWIDQLSHYHDHKAA